MLDRSVPVELTGIIDSVKRCIEANMTLPSCVWKDLTVEVVIEPELMGNAWVLDCPNRLHQALGSLASEAITVMNGQGVLRFALTKDDEHYRLRVNKEVDDTTELILPILHYDPAAIAA